MFWYSAIGWSPVTRSRPDRQMQPPAPPFRPATRPERSADDDAHGTPERRRAREEHAEAVDAECTDRIADRVAEVGVFVLARLHRLALRRIDRRQHQAAVQRQRESVGEEERDGD